MSELTRDQVLNKLRKGEKESQDPHIWHDPLNAKIMVNNLRDALVKRDPANAADYRYRQGSALHGLHNFAGARKAYDAALLANPQHVDARYQRALLNFAERQLPAAIADLDITLRLSPRAANA